VAHAVENAVPRLIIHGENDSLNPAAVSGEFVASAPRLTRLVVVPGAGHGESWNVDPVSYEQAVAGFLGEIAVGPAAASGGEG
jgi:pimeloyl-ACP methyl ester carboxylesterase